MNLDRGLNTEIYAKMEAKRRESMKMEIGQCLEHALDQLRDIWNEIGICEDQRGERQNVVLHHIRNLLSEMVTEEESLRQRLMKSVASSTEKVTTLCIELALQQYEPDSGISILQLEKALRLQVEQLGKEKSDRLGALEGLQKVEQTLCDILCTTPYYIPSGTVPSQEQLGILREHIDTLTAEKDQRHKTFTSTKKEILSYMEYLEQGPETSFEREVICEEEEAFVLSKENIQALKDLHQELEFKDTENKHAAEELRDRVTALWNRLSIPKEEREETSAKLQGHKPSNLTTLQEEVAKLEILKRQNLRKVVDAIREELEGWWNKCFYSRSQRNQFEAFYEDEITEDLLTLHDEELVRVKGHYETNQEMLDAVRKREDMWKKMLEFERKAIDPNRFNNRGGNLLEEERIRRKLNKDLPKIEQKLSDRIEEYERQTGTEFLVDGCRFMDYVAAQWAAHENEKKVIKEERLNARKRITEEEMLHGSKPSTPTKRRFVGLTPTKTPKRLRGANGSVAASPRLYMSSAHSSIMPSPRASRTKPPTGASTARPSPVCGKPPFRIPFPSPSTSRYNSRLPVSIYSHTVLKMDTFCVICHISTTFLAYCTIIILSMP
ncbi:protein regulator of cytokinesis 1 isoform X3 [Strongylocentrotus purpuratus]|uniref:Protein regulator of cytokinesis 1 n=1 Tax=Strongylocentrotus purpuratus TaxID=7668 RepID=A0A7M7P0F0_STRPU|nr:protein regulator of cytokinesis 1 isoform X3 [Strongylocentrotus purpuratus]